MDVEELIRRAWGSVQKAEVPETLHEVAFKEATDYLRSENGEDPRVNEAIVVVSRKGKKETLTVSTTVVNVGDFQSLQMYVGELRQRLTDF